MSQRIVSLIPSGTEILCALGFADELVGRSHECDFPSYVKSLAVCSEPRIDVHASSRSIDDQVRAALKEALSIYRVSAAELNRLQPTHIITQSQCEVCAVSLKDVQEAVCSMIGSHPEIISLEPMDLADLWKDIQRTANSLGNPERGRGLVEELQQRLKVIQNSIPVDRTPPRVLCLEWLDPLMSAGNWVPELVELAGGIPLLCTAGKHSPYFSWNDLLVADPDIIAIMPCGFDIPRTVSELPVLLSHPEWHQLRAVREGRVYITDGNQYFNRPGPRLVESAEILAEIFRAGDNNLPKPFEHQGSGWIQMDS